MKKIKEKNKNRIEYSESIREIINYIKTDLIHLKREYAHNLNSNKSLENITK